jgi:hypothetical protein
MYANPCCLLYGAYLNKSSLHLLRFQHSARTVQNRKTPLAFSVQAAGHSEEEEGRGGGAGHAGGVGGEGGLGGAGSEGGAQLRIARRLWCSRDQPGRYVAEPERRGRGPGSSQGGARGRGGRGRGAW